MKLPVCFNTSDQTQVTIGPWSYGLDFRPGLLFSPSTLLYGRVGFNCAHRKLDSDLENYGARSGSQPWTLPLVTSDSKRGCFLRLGGGIEQYLGEHLALRVDYIYTNYRTLSIEGSTLSTTVLSSGTVSATEDKELHLKNHALLVGLSYYFCNDPCSTCYTCCDTNFCGFYLAGGAGAALTDCHPHGDILNAGLSGTLFHELVPVQVASQLTDTDFRGNLYAGYGYQWRMLYAGLEAFAQYSPFSRSKTDEHNFLVLGLATTALSSVTTTARIDPWQLW